MVLQHDAISTFSYDGEGNPDTFSLDQLKIVVNSHFQGAACELKKLSKDSYYHKVYDIIKEDGTSLGVVRVASPAFPRDKLESEVATLKYLAEHTQIPVPEVYAWNSDACNPVGAEYIIMEKVPGVAADTQWDELPMHLKERVVSQIAGYLKAIFALRFEQGGSLYLSSPSRNEVHVGPIINIPFYRAIDGQVCAHNTPQLSTELSRYRGPFSNAVNYLQSALHATLHVLTHHRTIVLSQLDEPDVVKANTVLETGERVIHKVLELCTIYPGNTIPGGLITTPTRPFSISLDDFCLWSIMIDDKSGRVTGLIGFDDTKVAPLWHCAAVPGWLLDVNDTDGDYEGGSKEDKQHLLDVFWKTMDDAEWRTMYEHGKPFRSLAYCLSMNVGAWSILEQWVDEMLAWARSHPAGVGLPASN